MQTYHDEWEMNPKRISSSIVIAWGSAYRPRINYEFYDCLRLMQPYFDDQQYELYIANDFEFKFERAILAYLISTGVDLVFLCNENNESLNERLYNLLCNFQERYGISPIYVKCVEDLPLVPKYNHYFNVAASVALKEDRDIIQTSLADNELPMLKEFKNLIRQSENQL